MSSDDRPTRPPGGRDLPVALGDDHIGAILRGPESVYVYWTLRGPASRDALFELGQECKWILRVLDITNGASKSIPVDPDSGNYYLEVTPGSTYGFELAAWGQGRWRTVCRTERLAVPPGAPIPAADRPAAALERLRGSRREEDAPGLSYETTAPYLATSPGGGPPPPDA